MTKISLTKVEASKFMKFIKESSFALTEDEITGMNIFITTDGEKRFSLYRSLEKIKNKFKSIIKKLTGKSPPGRGSVQHILYLSPRIQLR